MTLLKKSGGAGEQLLKNDQFNIKIYVNLG